MLPYQFGNRGCAITTLQNISNLLLSTADITAVSTISRNDFSENGQIDIFELKVPGIEEVLFLNKAEVQATRKNHPDAAIKNVDKATTYKFQSKGEVKGDIVQEAITRIMLFIKFGPLK